MTPEEAWQKLYADPESFLSANNLQISGLDDKVAGNYPCCLQKDEVSKPYEIRSWGKLKAAPGWKISVRPADSPDLPGGYRIPQTCFYVPMYDAEKAGSPVQTHAAVSGDAEVVVTGQLTGCTFAVCGGGDSLHLAHIRPTGLGPAGNTKEAFLQRKVNMSELIRHVMPSQPTMQESTRDTPVIVIGIKTGGAFKFYGQCKDNQSRRITGVTKF